MLHIYKDPLNHLSIIDSISFALSLIDDVAGRPPTTQAKRTDMEFTDWSCCWLPGMSWLPNSTADPVAVTAIL